jgi:hypothetical protein
MLTGVLYGVVALTGHASAEGVTWMLPRSLPYGKSEGTAQVSGVNITRVVNCPAGTVTFPL